jgi:prevent-host-death family protein
MFSTADLVCRTDDVMRAAVREAVAITEHSRPKFVLMTAGDYNQLRSKENPHRHFHVSKTPDSIIELFGDQLCQSAWPDR